MNLTNLIKRCTLKIYLVFNFINMITKFIGVKEFRQNLAQISKQAQNKKERLIILRKNEPIFELKPLSKKDIILEKLIIDVQDAMDDMKKGKVYTNEEIKSMFGVE